MVDNNNENKNYVKSQGCDHFSRTKIVKLRNESTHVRSGKFLWMEDGLKREYLKDLKRRIENGYFFNESIVAKIVDDIAPVMDDCIDKGTSLNY